MAVESVAGWSEDPVGVGRDGLKGSAGVAYGRLQLCLFESFRLKGVGGQRPNGAPYRPFKPQDEGRGVDRAEAARPSMAGRGRGCGRGDAQHVLPGDGQRSADGSSVCRRRRSQDSEGMVPEILRRREEVAARSGRAGEWLWPDAGRQHPISIGAASRAHEGYRQLFVGRCVARALWDRPAAVSGRGGRAPWADHSTTSKTLRMA